MKIFRLNQIRGVIDPTDIQTTPKEVNYKMYNLFKSTVYIKGRKAQVKYYEDREKSKLVLVKELSDMLDEASKLVEIQIILKWAYLDGVLSDDAKVMFVAFTPEESDRQLIKRRKRIISKLRRDAEGTPMESLTIQLFKDFKEEITLFEQTGSDEFKTSLLNGTQEYLAIKVSNVEVRHIIAARLWTLQEVKDNINQVVKENQSEQITAGLLNGLMHNIVDYLNNKPIADIDIPSSIARDSKVENDIESLLDGVADEGNTFSKLFNLINSITESEGIKWSKLIIVDAENGNDTIAQKYDISKPFKTILNAINEVVSGDVIYVVSGEYTDSNLLKDGVNYVFDKNGGTINATAKIFYDNGVAITSKIYAENWTFQSSAANPVECTGETYLYFAFDRIISTGGPCIFFFPTTANNFFELKENYTQGTYYGFNPRGESRGIFTVKHAHSTGTTIFFRSAWNGDFVVNCEQVTTTTGGGHMISSQHGTESSKLVLNVSVINAVDEVSTAPVFLYGSGQCEFNADVKTNNRLICDVNKWQGGTGKLVIRGNYYSNTGLPFLLESSGKDVIMDNVTIQCQDYINPIILRRTINLVLRNVLIKNSKEAANGISHEGTGKLIVESAIIECDGESITATSAKEIMVLHSLALNKTMNANITNVITPDRTIINNQIEIL